MESYVIKGNLTFVELNIVIREKCGDSVER